MSTPTRRGKTMTTKLQSRTQQAIKKPYCKPEMEICDLPDTDIVTASNIRFNNRGYKQTQFDIFDLKGNKLMMIDGVVGTLSLAKLPAGMYMVKVSSGSASKTQAISIK